MDSTICERECDNVPELLKKKQVARLLNCSERTVDRRAKEGRIPRPIKMGAAKQSAVYWRKSEVLGSVERGLRPVDSPAGESQNAAPVARFSDEGRQKTCPPEKTENRLLAC
jgi:predicted DNA-binding transcriptional regulator AlpA